MRSSELHHRGKAVAAMLAVSRYAQDIDDLDAMLDAARHHIAAWLAPDDATQRIQELERQLADAHERYELLAAEFDRRVSEWRDLDDLRRAENDSLRKRLGHGRHRRRRRKGRYQ